MIAYADLASRTRRIWIIELTRTVCPGTKQHRIMHSRNPRRRYFLLFFFFFSSASFLLYFYLCSNVCTGENIPGWKIIYKILAKLFEKFFRSKLLDGILKNLVTLIIPRNSRNLILEKFKKKFQPNLSKCNFITRVNIR